MARRSMQVEGKLVVDEKSFAAGIRKAVADTNRLSSATKRANRTGFSGFAKNALKAAAATASLYTVYDQGRKAINTTKDLAKGTIQLTRTTGLSTKEASRFVAVAKVRGIETQKLATSFTILSKQIVAAQGGSEKAAEAFKRLGVSQEAIKRGDTRQVFLDAADGLSKMENGANKTALAAQLFGRGYQALFPILDMGSKGIAEQLGLAGRLGAELSGNSVEAFKKYAQAEREAKLAQMGLQIQLGEELIPLLTKGVAKVSNFIQEWRKDGSFKEAKSALRTLGDVISTVAGILKDHPKAVLGVTGAYIGLKTTIKAIKFFDTIMTSFGTAAEYAKAGAARGAAFGAAFQVAAALGMVYLVVQGVEGAINQIKGKGAVWAKSIFGPMLGGLLDQITGVGSQAGNLGQRIKNGYLGQAFTKWFADLKSEAQRVWEFLKKIFGGGSGKLATIKAPNISGLSGLVSKVRSAMASVLKSVSSTASRLVSAGARLAASVISGFASKAKGIASGAARAASSAVSNVKERVGSMVSAGSSLASGIATGIRNSVGSVLDAVRALAASIPDKFKKLLGIGSPSKVFIAFGANIVEGLAIGIRRSIPLATTAAAQLGQAVSPYTSNIGLADDFAVGLAQRELSRARGMKKGKKGSKRRRRRTRAIREAEGDVKQAEATRDRNDRRREALNQVKDFISQLVETAKTNFLKPITDAINARSAKRQGRADTRTRAEIVRRLERARGAMSDPTQRAFLERQQTRLTAQLTAARRRGDTERIGQLQEELKGITDQLSGDYVSQLEDELGEFDDTVLLRNAEAAANQIGDKLQAKLNAAFAALASRGGVAAFLKQLGTALTATLTSTVRSFGSTSGAALGLTPGRVGAMAGGSDLGSSLVTAGGAGTIPLSENIANWLRGKSQKKSYKASAIAKAIGSSKAAVYGVTGSKFRGYKIANRASGGRLAPGMLTMVGETGPELVVGGKVLSGTRTSRLGGGSGMNITINATGAVADNPQLLARELGWQLATR